MQGRTCTVQLTRFKVNKLVDHTEHHPTIKLAQLIKKKYYIAMFNNPGATKF